MAQVRLSDIPPLLEPPDEEVGRDLFRRFPALWGIRNGLLAAGIIGGLIYLIVYSSAQSRHQLEAVFTEEREDLSEVEDLRAVGYDELGKTWEVYSRAAQEGRKSNVSDLQEVAVLNVYKEGQLNLTGHGDHATYRKGSDVLELRDNVYLEDREGVTTLVTGFLKWNEKTEEMFCPEPVDVTIETNRIVADSLFGTRDLKELHFIGSVRMYLTGIEGENLLTREGIVDPADAEPVSEDPEDAGEGMWVAATYVRYDKETKLATCYPYLPASVRQDLRLYLPKDLNPLTRSAPQAPSVDFAQRQVETVEAWLNQEEFRTAAQVDLLFGPLIPEALQERRDRQVFAWQTNKRLFANRLDIDLKAKRADPRFEVFFYAENFEDRIKPDSSKTGKALAKEVTSMAGDFMRYYWKKGLMEGWDGVDLFQRDKRLEADYIVNHEEIGVIAADGNVVIHQASGDWLEREGLLDDVTEEKAREDARERTTIYCDAALGYERGSYLYCEGQVKIIQPDQRAWADAMEYHEGDEWLMLTGRVDYANDKGETLKGDKVVFWLDTSVYEVTHATDTRIEMPEKYRRQIEEAKGEDEEESAE